MKQNIEDEFGATKIALFLGRRILVILRDDIPGIPFPGHWDFPGGGREPGETPEMCIRREVLEETALALTDADLNRVAFFQRVSVRCWFFAAHLPEVAQSQVVLGDEGQRWVLMAPQQYMRHPLRIPHFAEWLASYVADRACPS